MSDRGTGAGERRYSSFGGGAIETSCPFCPKMLPTSSGTSRRCWWERRVRSARFSSFMTAPKGKGTGVWSSADPSPNNPAGAAALNSRTVRLTAPVESCGRIFSTGMESQWVASAGMRLRIIAGSEASTRASGRTITRSLDTGAGAIDGGGATASAGGISTRTRCVRLAGIGMGISGAGTAKVAAAAPPEDF